MVEVLEYNDKQHFEENAGVSDYEDPDDREGTGQPR